VSLALVKTNLFFGLASPWLLSRLNAAEVKSFPVACDTYSYGGKVPLVKPYSETMILMGHILVPAFYGSFI